MQRKKEYQTFNGAYMSKSKLQTKYCAWTEMLHRKKIKMLNIDNQVESTHTHTHTQGKKREKNKPNAR